MKHVGNTIEHYINAKRMLKKNVAEDAHISPEYLSLILKKETIDASLLERICKAIKINPAVFFDDSNEQCYLQNLNTTDISDYKSDNVLKEQIVLLNKIIEEKERLIQHLLKK